MLAIKSPDKNQLHYRLVLCLLLLVELLLYKSVCLLGSSFAEIEAPVQTGVKRFCEFIRFQRRTREALFARLISLIFRHRRQAINRSCKACKIDNQQKYKFASPATHLSISPFSENTFLSAVPRRRPFASTSNKYLR